MWSISTGTSRFSYFETLETMPSFSGWIFAYQPSSRIFAMARAKSLSESTAPSIAPASAGVSGSLTAKAALLIWAKGLSRVVAKHGVTVNCLSPGILMTDQIRNYFIPRTLPTAADQERFLTHDVPAGRFGEPSDAAHLIAFLSSPKAGYITGQRVYVDGGWNRHV